VHFQFFFDYYVMQDASNHRISLIFDVCVASYVCIEDVLIKYGFVLPSNATLRGELRARIRRLVIDVGISLSSYFRWSIICCAICDEKYIAGRWDEFRSVSVFPPTRPPLACSVAASAFFSKNLAEILLWRARQETTFALFLNK